MAKEACRAADEYAVVEAVALFVEKTRKTEHGVGNDVVAEYRLPAYHKAAALHELEKAIYKACQHSGTEAPAGAVQEYREHTEVDGAALRKLKELEIAQHLRQSNHDGTLAERAELEMRFGFHVSFLLNCDFVIWGSRI